MTAILAIPGGGAVIPTRVMAPPILDTAVRKETLMKASTATGGRWAAAPARVTAGRAADT